MGDEISLSSFPEVFGSWSDYTPAASVAGSISIPQAPEPSSVIGDWASGLAAFTSAAASTAKAITGFQTARDNAANAAADRSFNQFAKTQELDLARSSLQAKTDLGKLTLAAQIAQAQKSLANPVPSILQLASGQAPAQSYIMLALLAVGGLWFWKKAKHA
jgi:hypothetical protein